MTPREQEVAILTEALAALKRTTGLEGTITAVQPAKGGGVPADATIELRAQGKRLRLLAEIKAAVDRVVLLTTVKNQFGRQAGHGVLVTRYLTAELAGYCRDPLDLQFIDTAGNAYLRAPGLLVFVRGGRPPANGLPVRLRGVGTVTDLRVVFALLCKPELLNAPYRDIARTAGVALGGVGPVLLDLHRRGYLAGGARKRNRRLMEPDRLLDEWATNFPIKLRPKLNPRRFHAADPHWWQTARLDRDVYWGGEVAAARLTGHLQPAAQTIYLGPEAGPKAVAALVKQHRLHADPRGTVELLDTFWDTKLTPNTDVVPPVLVYADLMATLDPRNLEIATRIRREHMKHAVGPA